MANPRSTLEAFSEETLLFIADKIGRTLTKSQQKNVVDTLIEDLREVGINKVLSVVKLKNLKLLCDHPEVGIEEHVRELSPKRAKSPDPKKKKKEKKYPSKSAMVKILCELAKKKGLNNFLDMYDRNTLLECCKDIDDLKGMSDAELEEIEKKKLTSAIKANVNSFGMNHMFGNFSASELQTFCKELGLKNDVTGSTDILIDAIIEHENYKKPKKRKEQKPSKEKPEIVAGISKVDLNSWYNKDDLEQWLRNKGCKVSGKKSEIVTRVLKFLDGDHESTMPNKQRGRKKRGRSKSPNKSSEDKKKKKKKLEKSDEGSKEEKNENSENKESQEEKKESQ